MNSSHLVAAAAVCPPTRLQSEQELALLTPGDEAVLDPGQMCAVTPDAGDPAAMAAAVTDATPPAFLICTRIAHGRRHGAHVHALAVRSQC